jgi:hypothetical protein
MKKTLFSCFFLLIANLLTAQSIVVTVGTETTNGYYAPFNPYYHYSWNQCIYNASEIGVSGDITSIAWHCANNQSSLQCSDITIYMGTITDSTHTLGTDWLPMDSLTMVYQGQNVIIGNQTGWKTFYLNTPFHYDGTRNLVVVVSKTSDDNSAQRWSFTSKVDACLYRQSDNDPTFSSHPGTNGGTLYYARANIQLGIDTLPGNCVRPENLTAANITNHSADITWLNMGNETSWQVVCLPQGTMITPYVYTTTVTTTAYTLNNLFPNTGYDFYVRAVCGTNDYSTWNHIPIHTLSDNVANVPYFCDFEDTAETNRWVLNPNPGTNDWAIGSATHEGPGTGHSMYISNDNGATNFYDGNSESSSWAYRDIDLPAAAQYVISFDWKGIGSYSSSPTDYMQVFIGDPTSIPASNGLPTGLHPIGGFFYAQNSWQHFEGTVDSSFAGTKRLYFRWVNNSYSASNPPAAVDNVMVTNTSCGAPYNLTLDTVTANSATLSWQSFSASDSLWVIRYGTFGTDPDSMATLQATTTTYTITGLTASQAYECYVTSSCGGAQRHITFKTDCGPITQLPVRTGFESDTLYTTPYCWHALTTENTNCYVTTTEPYEGNASLFIPNSCYVSLPVIGGNLAMNNLQIGGWIVSSSSSTPTQLIVGIMSDPDDYSTFVAVDTVNIGNSFQFFEVNTANYTGYGHYLSLNATGYSCYLDNVELSTIPPCPRPLDVTVDSTTLSSVYLSWTETGTATSWRVTYGPQGFTPGGANSSTVTASATHTVIPNIPAAIPYDFYVQADCGGQYSLYSVPATGATGGFNIPTTGTVTLNTCSAILYDDGGVNGDYSINCNATVVLQPSSPNSVMTISGTINLENNYDFIYVYEGTSATGTPLYTGTGTTVMPTIVSASGPLTVKFTSDYAIVKSGFELTVQCQQAPSCATPSNMRIIATEANSLTLTWTENGTATQWDIYYGKQMNSFTPDLNYPNMTVTTDTITVTGLWVGTTYDFYVRANCGVNTSALSSVFSAVPGRVFMPHTGTTSMVMCSGDLFDDGGFSGNYSSNCNGELIIYPSTPGAAASLSGDYRMAYGDTLRIFDGAGTSGNMLFHQYGNMSSYQNLPSTVSTTGPLTIQLKSDNGTTAAGFHFSVSCVTCIPPIPAVDHLDSTFVSLHWSDLGGAQTEWEIAYGPTGFNVNNATPIIVTTNSPTLTGLTPDMVYDCYVRTRCGASDHSTWGMVTFHTMPASPAHIPYFCDFEDSVINNAWIISTHGPNEWFIGNTVNQDMNGSNCLYISNDGGAHNEYNIHFAGVSWAYRDIYFDPATEYTLSFDWRAMGGNNAYLSVYLGDPETVDLTYPYDNPANSTTLFAKLYGQSSWQTATYTLNSSWAGTTKRLYFRWVGGDPNGQNPPAAIDNLSIFTETCGQPQQVTASNITSTTAHIAWTPADSLDTAWAVVYGPVGVDPDAQVPTIVHTPEFDISGLSPMLRYEVYVRTQCDAGQHSVWSVMCPFNAACGPMDLPYSDDFSLYPSNVYFPECWHILTNYSSNPTIFHSSAAQYLMVPGNNNSYCFVILPEVSSLYASNNLEVDYSMRTGNVQNYMEIGMMTDFTDPSTFVPLDTMVNATDTAFESGYTSFASYTGNGRYIAFKCVFPASGFIRLDDIYVGFLHDPYDTCATPRNLTAQNLSATSTMLTWTQNMNLVQGWEVYYRAMGDTAWTIVPTTSTSYILTGLTENEPYEAFVIAHCLYGLVSTSDTITFIPVGISVHNESNIILYPNPTSGKVRVQSLGNGIKEVSVYDVTGRLVIPAQTGTLQDETTVIIDAANLPTGIYFAKILLGDNVWITKRFIKQ